MKHSAVKNEKPNISGAIWDKDIPDIINGMKEAGVTEFTISASPCGVTERLAVFEANGAILQGLTRVNLGAVNSATFEEKLTPAFLMKII